MYRAILLVCGLATLVSSFPAAFDNVNIDTLLTKPEVVDAYIDCLLENTACTESGLRLKGITPNALLERCSQCTPYQRESVQKISKAISTKKPAQWEKILEKYDPSSQHRSEIESLIKAKPAEPEKPIEPKPEDAPKPAEPAKTEDQLKPEPAKTDNSPKTALKPAETAEPLKPEPAKLEEPAKPEAAKPAEPEKSAQPEKSAEPEKPDLAKKPDASSS